MVIRLSVFSTKTLQSTHAIFIDLHYEPVAMMSQCYGKRTQLYNSLALHFFVSFCIYSPERLSSKLLRLTLRFIGILSAQIPNNHRELVQYSAE